MFRTFCDPVGRLDAEVVVILYRDADEVGHRILRRISQCIGIHRCGRRLFRGNLSPLRGNGCLFLCHQRHGQQQRCYQCYNGSIASHI